MSTPKTPGLKLSAEEPAKRILEVELSAAELAALINYHGRHAQRLIGCVGKIVMGPLTFKQKGPAMMAAKAQIDAHCLRAGILKGWLDEALIMKPVKAAAKQPPTPEQRTLRACQCGALPERLTLKGNGVGDFFIECPACKARSSQVNCEHPAKAWDRWNDSIMEGFDFEG